MMCKMFAGVNGRVSSLAGPPRMANPASQWRWRRALLAIVASMLISGCGLDNFFAGTSEVPLELDYNRVLPQGWQPIARWHEVSIDGDGDTEYLLLFTYDSGQVGAVIYDQQISTDLVGATLPAAEPEDGAPMPLQAFGYYRPYLLLPSNWDHTYGGEVSHGFIAHPSDADNVTVSTVTRGANYLTDALGLGGPEGRGTIHPPAELVIRGGTTHLTFVWWKNRHEGYGVTQLFAPGGFRGIDWPTWRDNPRPIDEISGLYPVIDYRARSLLCRETAFRRAGLVPATDGATMQEPSEIEGMEGIEEEEGAEIAGDIAEGEVANDSDERLPSIAFTRQDLGLHFCTPSIPAHPFYPEGVALAYLLQAEDGAGSAAQARREGLVTPGVGMGMLDGELNPPALASERINDIQAFATVPVTSDVIQNGVFSPTTSVCLELARLDNPDQRRWLLFTLRYHAPDMEARTPDRWTISGITEQPRPVDAGISGSENGDARSYCRVILGMEDTERE